MTLTRHIEVLKILIKKHKEILEIWVNGDIKNLIEAYHKRIDTLTFLLTLAEKKQKYDRIFKLLNPSKKTLKKRADDYKKEITSSDAIIDPYSNLY